MMKKNLFWPLVLIILLVFSGCASSNSAAENTAGQNTAGQMSANTARQNKEKLMEYLYQEQGKRILAGQMDTSWSNYIDPVARVYKDTGRYPAIKGFDFLNIRHPEWEGGGSQQTRDAINWWRNSPIKGKNGIVTFCWHWRMPLSGSARGAAENYTRGFTIPYKDGKLDRTDPRFTLIQDDLDLVAAELAKLRDAGVPVLWRPLHEAAGGWFWWGANAIPYIALWEYMHDYFTNEKGLDNLIWVWNGQNGNWYPNPDTVDIASYDAYESNRERPGYEPNYANDWHHLYTQLKTWAPGKLAALSENGAIPDPAVIFEGETYWSWFMTWDDHSTAAGVTSKNNHWTGEYHNTNAHKKYVYRHSRVVTLDKLPQFSK
ncbi:MAG: glycoside hydrolase family 26 protein [Treponema sp.]|jgi:mannan endo-1,4-beta-mannosidase|nr:glycoside hydrolase family 26 protein [Treponema sp.]